MTGGKATKHIVETIAKVIFLICAAVAIVAVLSITVYMLSLIHISEPTRPY